LNETLVIRFSEITLKGRNRHLFEGRMAKNIALHLRSQGEYKLTRQHARMEIAGPGELELAADIVGELPGVANVSIAHRVSREVPALAQACIEFVQRQLAHRADAELRPITFGMDVERKDKRYPIRSMDLAAQLGRAIQDHFPHLRVNLTEPDIWVQVEIVESGALVFADKRPGPGGLAVGSSGKAICLLSGGIDSPVAAYLMMTRGVSVVHLNFHSYPFIGEQSREKVRDIVRFLARYQPASRLYTAPFAEIQTAIRDHCPEGLRTILYRRMMNRVANKVAEQEHALALVTGESVGQVASQTLENLAAIHATAKFPVLQPLSGLAKPEIIARARRIGTYELSIQPFPDCCTLFQPRRPETKANLHVVERAESALDVDTLVDACVARLEITDFGPEYFPAGWHT
jgi:thiamine biosynthesis protein ThiI